MKMLSAVVRKKGLGKIKAKAKELGLQFGEPTSLTGTDPVNPAANANDSARETSIARYAAIWHPFIDYCILTEDYESGILPYLEAGIQDPCPPSEATMINFACYKVKQAHELHKHYVTEEPIRFDSVGLSADIYCQEQWTSVSTLNLL